MDTVVYGPLLDVCDRKYGPFEAVRQMMVRTHYVSFVFEYLLSFIEEGEDIISMIFFGEVGNTPFDVKAFLDQYVIQYFAWLAPLGGPLEGEIHIWSLLFDGLIEEPLFEIIKTPVCGIE